MIYIFFHFELFNKSRRTSISNLIINKILFFFLRRLSLHPPSFQQPFFSTLVILAEDRPLSPRPSRLVFYLSLSLSLSLVPSPPHCSWWVLAGTPLHYDIMFPPLSTAECLNVGYIVAAH